MANYAKIERIVNGIRRTFAEVNRLESVNDIVFDTDRYIQNGIHYKNIWLDSLDLPYNKSKHIWKIGDTYTVEENGETVTKIVDESDPRYRTIKYSVNDAIEARIRKSVIMPSEGMPLEDGTFFGKGDQNIVTAITPIVIPYEDEDKLERNQVSIIQWYNNINDEHPTSSLAQQFHIRGTHDVLINKVAPIPGRTDNYAGGIEIDVDLTEYVKTINAGLKRGNVGPGQEDFTIRVDKSLDDHNLIVNAHNLPYTFAIEDDPTTPPVETNELIIDKTIGEAIDDLIEKTTISSEDMILSYDKDNNIKAEVKLVKVSGSNHVEIQGKLIPKGDPNYVEGENLHYDLGDFDIAVGVELVFNAIIPRTENGSENTSDPSLQVMGKWSFINLPDISDDQKKEITKALDFQFGEILSEPNTGPAVAIYDNEDGSKTYINIKNIEVGHYLVFGFKDVGATQNPVPTKPSDPTGPNLENRHISYTAINLSKLISPYYAGDSIGIKKGQEISLVLHEDTDRDLKLADSTEKDIRGNPKKKLILDFFTGTQSEFDNVMSSGGKNGEAFSNSDPEANIVAGFDGTYFIYDEE